MVPKWFLNLFVLVGKYIKKFFTYIKDEFVDIYTTFVYGDWKTKMSFFIMGFGSIARGKVLRGILFLVFQVVFIVYLCFGGIHWLSKFKTLGDTKASTVYDPNLDTYVRVDGDDSFKIMLYSLLTIIFIIAFIWTWRTNVKQNKIMEDILKSGKT